jgi:hypothetical protein
LRDPSHVRTLPLSELVRLLGVTGLDGRSVTLLDHEFVVDDWMMHCEQTDEQRQRAYALLRESIGQSTFIGKRVRQDADDKLHYRVRWAVLVATKPQS